jgi:hypothetical protein
MFSIKMTNKKYNKLVDKIFSFASDYIFNTLNFSDSRVLSDNNSFEIVSGKDTNIGKDDIIIEIVVRKTLVINKDSLTEDNLESHLTKIKKYCDKLRLIEDIS